MRTGAPQPRGPAPTAERDPLDGWAACLPDLATSPLWAEPFAEDLCAACTRAFDAFSGTRADRLTLPISVPFDENGVVVVSSAPPKPDAPRVPAELELVRGSPPSRYRFGLALARADRRPLLVPGITARDDPDLLPLTLLTFAVADGTGRSGHAGRTGRSGHAGRTGRSGHAGRGMAIAGYDADGRLADLHLDETTSRALAVALLITIGVKLTKAGYAG